MPLRSDERRGGHPATPHTPQVSSTPTEKKMACGGRTLSSCCTPPGPQASLSKIRTHTKRERKKIVCVERKTAILMRGLCVCCREAERNGAYIWGIHHLRPAHPPGDFRLQVGSHLTGALLKWECGVIGRRMCTLAWRMWAGSPDMCMCATGPWPTVIYMFLLRRFFFFFVSPLFVSGTYTHTHNGV